MILRALLVIACFISTLVKLKTNYEKYYFPTLFNSYSFCLPAQAKLGKLFKKKKAIPTTENPKYEKEDKDAIKPYDIVITAKAISDSGLFGVPHDRKPRATYRYSQKIQ